MQPRRTTIVILSCLFAFSANGDELSPRVKRWLVPQSWKRDTDGPILSLGSSSDFDAMHLFAPCVAYEQKTYRLWYCGSRGKVADRVFTLGLATSTDGKVFRKHADNPVARLADGERSILTPTLLRTPEGDVLRERGRLRMWFSSTSFHDKSGLHTLHEMSSQDGITWDSPSKAQLEHVYAPTVLKEKDEYLLWYVDVSKSPWIIRHARSKDGKSWKVHPEPVVKLDQAWEKGRLFYPIVVKCESVYLMWYGSYWAKQLSKTALGFAVSEDGITWHKHPDNPVFRPDPKRSWESHYTTSQSVMRLPDGSWRIWYASRTKPPFVHKYFAIGTAKWQGLPKSE